MPRHRVSRGRRFRGHRQLRGLSALVLLITCVAAAAAPPAIADGAPQSAGPAQSAGRSVARARAAGSGFALAGRAMWIWELPTVDGGNIGAIIGTAHRYGVGTLLIKSSDGTNLWSQFTPGLVAVMHRHGLRVCAWQYVYGDHPVTEAYMGADAVRDGADCLVIDAESEYQGKYIAAQTYLQRLRDLIGAGYPVALAGFPYVDYHPGFPYSVFLGPGGAQFNAPQMYWRDIGVTTDAVFAHTYSFNLIYGRPIFPLGQVYDDPPAHQIVRFRELSRVYGAGGISWWDFADASAGAWIAISRPAGSLPGYVPYTAMASIGYGAQGDLVIWAQEHLISAGYALGVDGSFGKATLADVLAFQTAQGLTADGIIGPETWQALLRYGPARILWAAAASGATAASAASAGRLAPGAAAIAARRRAAALLAQRRREIAAYAAGRRSAPLVMPLPRSAALPAKRNELAGSPGAGRPPGPGSVTAQ